MAYVVLVVLHLSSNGECEKIETIKVEGETLDLCELFGINCEDEEQSSTSETILAPEFNPVH